MKLSETIVQTITAMREQAPRFDLADKGCMVANLVFMYQVIVASEDLMQQAHDAATNTVLRGYLDSHLPEEHDHAAWLRSDLLTIGIDPEKSKLIRSAAELVGTQYYLIQHRNPNALLGYMAVLEGFPFDIELLEQLEVIHGKELLRCLRFHAVHDQEHRVELFRVIDELNDPDILQNAVRTQMLLNEAFAKLC